MRVDPCGRAYRPLLWRAARGSGAMKRALGGRELTPP
jgi:hypothetical protein